MSKEQPGCCDSFDKRQKKRDNRILKEAQIQEEAKQKSDAEIADLERNVSLDDETEEVLSNDNGEEFEIAKPRDRSRKKVNVMSHVSRTAD